MLLQAHKTVFLWPSVKLSHGKTRRLDKRAPSAQRSVKPCYPVQEEMMTIFKTGRMVSVSQGRAGGPNSCTDCGMTCHESMTTPPLMLLQAHKTVFLWPSVKLSHEKTRRLDKRAPSAQRRVKPCYPAQEEMMTMFKTGRLVSISKRQAREAAESGSRSSLTPCPSRAPRWPASGANRGIEHLSSGKDPLLRL